MSDTADTTLEEIEREATLETDPDRAWEAISDPDVLSDWLAEEVELELVEGSPARFVVDGVERHGVVREVEEGRRISFTWRAPEEPATLVELELTPLGDDGPVRLTVTETAPAGMPVSLAAEAAWGSRLERVLAGLAATEHVHGLLAA
jgi:uncharacterized protein YndB with AHSA1/START domain